MIRRLIKQHVQSVLWRGAARVLAAEHPYVIAVTGAVGKTTTKEALAHLLTMPGERVRAAAGNLNTEFGVPLAILGWDHPPRRPFSWLAAYRDARFKRGTETGGVLILEFSSDKKGDIAWLAERVPVNMAVFTRFTLAHSGETVAAVAAEKLSLLKGLVPDGCIVANADDPEQKGLLKDRRTVAYGLNGGAVRLKEVQLALTGARAVLEIKGRRHVLNSQLVANSQLLALAAALAAGQALGRDTAFMLKRAQDFTPPPGRLRLIAGRKGTTILDDSYNSSPAAAAEALATLTALGHGRRTVAILGNMNELGRNTVAAHLELGRAAAAAGVQYLVAVGPNAKRILRGAREAGMLEPHMIEFSTTARLVSRLDNLVQSGDIILVKASQNGMWFERVVKALMAKPQEARRLLVRQE